MLRKAISLIVDDGQTTWQAAATLNALGYRPRRSPRWNHHNLRRVLQDSRMAGEWSYGGMAVAIPPVITPERHALLRTRLSSTSSGPRDPADDGFYLLSRGVLLSPCGGTYHGVARRDRGTRQYRCGNARYEAVDQCECRRLPGVATEAAVWEAVVDLLAQPGRLFAMAEAYLELSPGEQPDPGELAKLGTQIDSLDRAINTTAVNALRAELDPGMIAGAVAQLQRERAALADQRALLVAWEEQAAAHSDRARRLTELCAVARDRLDALDPRGRREILDLLEVHVTVRRWEPCDACGGRGKVRGGTGGLPCASCHAVRSVPHLRVEGRVWESFLDVMVGDLPDGVLRRCRCCSPSAPG